MLEETGVFFEWLGYAKSMTEAMILGDSADRQTRRDKIKKYLNNASSSRDFIIERHLDANYKRLFFIKRETASPAR